MLKLIMMKGVYGCYSLFGPSAGQTRMVIKNNMTFEKRTAQTGKKGPERTTAGLCARHFADQKFVICVRAFLQL